MCHFVKYHQNIKDILGSKNVPVPYLNVVIDYDKDTDKYPYAIFVWDTREVIESGISKNKLDLNRLSVIKDSMKPLNGSSPEINFINDNLSKINSATESFSGTSTNASVKDIVSQIIHQELSTNFAGFKQSAKTKYYDKRFFRNVLSKIDEAPQINKGFCVHFADYVAEKANLQKVKIHGNFDYHVGLYIDGLFFDTEHPDGLPLEQTHWYSDFPEQMRETMSLKELKHHNRIR